MLELINDIKNISIDISIDIKQSFKNKKLVFSTTTPNYIFLSTYYVLDFDKENLVEIDYRNEYNVTLLNQYDSSLINIPSHSIIPCKNGFYSFATNAPTDCFRYINLDNYQTFVYTKDDFSLSELVHLKSAGYHNLNNENLILAFSTQDNKITIIECDHDMKIIDHLATVDRNDIFIHDIIYKDQTLLLSNFEFFRVIDKQNNVIAKEFKDFKLLVDNGYVPGKDNRYRQNFGELFVINTINNNCYIQNTSIGPTAHFIIDKNDIYLSMHNVTTINGIHYHYTGTAGISKWNLKNNSLTHIVDFTDETYYRAPQPLLYHVNDNPYLMTFSHPNRLYSINAKTMDVNFTYDFDESYDLKLINTIDNMKLQEKYCYNDINISTDGKYACIFECDKIKIFNTENKCNEAIINFPRDPSSMKNDYFRRITHTCLL